MSEERTGNGLAGTLKSIYRHPVKSMIEEELDACDVTAAGLCGDRAYALIDVGDGKVASAKNPRKWGNLLEWRAQYENDPEPGEDGGPVRITAPDGLSMLSSSPDVHADLSKALGRNVRLNRRGSGHEGMAETTLADRWAPRLEEYWPEDVEGLAYSGVVTDEPMPEDTFFDLATIHLLTTATLDALGQLYPSGQFDVRRFRPNLVIAPPEGETGFVENSWIGKTVQIGEDLQLAITGPCPRCVMTTLPQRGLPKNTGVLRAAAQHNGAHVGVYASVVRNGRVQKGDIVRIAGPGIAD